MFQEELLTDLEAQLDEDVDQGKWVSSAMVIDVWQFVQCLGCIPDCQEIYVFIFFLKHLSGPES